MKRALVYIALVSSKAGPKYVNITSMHGKRPGLKTNNKQKQKRIGKTMTHILDAPPFALVFRRSNRHVCEK